MDITEINDIKFLLTKCENRIDVYRNRAIESTILHDADGSEHDPTKQLFRDIKRCENAVNIITNILNIEIEKNKMCFGNYGDKNCCQCCDVAVECYEKTNQRRI